MPIRHGGRRFEERQHLAPSESFPDDDLFVRVDPVDLEHVLGDIQADRRNLHVDGSPHVIRRNDHSMALRCWERAPSTTSNPDFLLGGRTSASAECRHWSGEGSLLVKLRNSA